ncbi:TonB-dependent receptor [Endozoicomonas sp. G2_1]|uniref:TonB-dependent receptor domain-containing protein n=1 Tax=Endozoicomonas sp. G2_1 TaxID=2821091 RepID=UPI001ADD0A5C|nr:TonB-dependent receptor [Endozoicomonas sp. G2_1]MBO9491494.1 TonB-dependent receptor [Endozoicomonas sp. G2_1]
MYQNNKLTRAIRLAVAAGVTATAFALPSTAALAQEAESEESVERIAVTGSRILNPNVESSSPVVTVEAELFDIRGTTDAVDLLNTLPSFFADQTTAFANGATGTSTANLRGLGSTRTLVLVDGKRLPPGGPLATFAQDLNLVAPQMVERVDVVTGGASAVYGSDAISGVVNFITRKDFEGVEVDFQYGFNQSDNNSALFRDALEAVNQTPQRGSVTDNDTFQLNLLMGSSTADGRGNVTAYLNYSKSNGVQQGDRDFSQCATFPTGDDQLVCLGSNQGPFPTTFVVDGTGYSLGQDDTLTEGFNNPFNFNPFNPIRRAVERFNIGFSGYYDLADEVTSYMDFGFTTSQSPQVIAPSAAFGSTINRVNCNNPVLTPETRNVICGTPDINGQFSDRVDENGFAQAQIRRRFVEGGPRTDDRTRTNFRSVMGVRGVIDDTFDWDVFAQYSETRLQRVQFNQVTLDNLTRALDIVADPTTGNPVCRSVVDGTDPNCIPFVSAYQNGLTSDPGLAAYVDTPTLTSGTGKQTIVGGTIGGDLTEFNVKSPLADEGISVIAGFEWRRDELFQQADGIAAAGNLVGAGGATTPVNAETRVTEFFFEAQVPLVSGVTGVEQLNLTTAYRYSDYESTNNLNRTVGGEFDTDTWAFGLAWVPYEDVRVRAQFQRAVRAPNINELFAPQNTNLSSLSDPCAGSTPSATQAQCANTGLSAALFGNVPPDSGQLNLLTGGNPNLEPEESDTYTLGVVYQPSFVDNLSVSVDYFDITLENAIDTVPAAVTLNQCITNGSPEFCSLITRGPDGSLTFFPREQAFIEASNQNIAEFATTGIDFQIIYSLEGEFGEFTFNYNSTYLTSIEETSLPGTPSFDCAGFYGNGCGDVNPEYRHNFVTTWNTPIEDLSASLVWRHVGSTNLAGTVNSGFGQDGSITTAVQDGDRSIDESVESENYLDLTVFYQLTESVQLRAGVNNVLDNDPPVVTTFGPASGVNVEANTVAGVYDAAGRFIFVGATVNF